MSVVYQIDLPDLTFYIGSTQNLLQRLSAHLSARTTIGDAIRAHNLSMDELCKCTHIIYRGIRYKEEEEIAIWNHRTHLTMINTVALDPNRVRSCIRVFKPKVDKRVYQSIKLEDAVYKKADFLKSISVQDNGKRHTMSSIIEKGLDFILHESKEV